MYGFGSIESLTIQSRRRSYVRFIVLTMCRRCKSKRSERQSTAGHTSRLKQFVLLCSIAFVPDRRCPNF